VIARATGQAAAAIPLVKVTDGLTLPGPAGPLPIRIYTPSGAGPFPVIVYFHGGGFVIATLDTYDTSARALAAQTAAIVCPSNIARHLNIPFRRL
jgi:acetyl esterase